MGCGSSQQNYKIVKYEQEPESVIIACFYNPTRSIARLKAFRIWYDSVSHLNLEIIECVLKGQKPQLSKFPKVRQITTKVNLWHKEAILNKIIRELDSKKYKYVYWCDTDVYFDNPRWLIDGAKLLSSGSYNIIQPFDCCVHLEKNRLRPHFNFELEKRKLESGKGRHPNIWRSFAYVYATNPKVSTTDNYDAHGHVGFVWGARLDLLKKTLLYDHCLIGGADHIMAHAALNQLNHPCTLKAFEVEIEKINKWSKEFGKLMQGKLGYVKSNLFHIWHGDLKNRQYLKRIQEFTPLIQDLDSRDDNGLYFTDNDAVLSYFDDYMSNREDSDGKKKDHNKKEDGDDGGDSGGNNAGWDDPSIPPPYVWIDNDGAEYSGGGHGNDNNRDSGGNHHHHHHDNGGNHHHHHDNGGNDHHHHNHYDNNNNNDWNSGGNNNNDWNSGGSSNYS